MLGEAAVDTQSSPYYCSLYKVEDGTRKPGFTAGGAGTYYTFNASPREVMVFAGVDVAVK